MVDISTSLLSVKKEKIIDTVYNARILRIFG